MGSEIWTYTSFNGDPQALPLYQSRGGVHRGGIDPRQCLGPGETSTVEMNVSDLICGHQVFGSTQNEIVVEGSAFYDSHDSSSSLREFEGLKFASRNFGQAKIK